MKKTLYPWQEDCLTHWFSNHGRGMVQAATGTGKTLLALTAADRLNRALNDQLLVKIVVPTGALMRQWHRALRESLLKSGTETREAADIQRKIGLRGGSFRMPSDRKYMIYVINSARYELARQILSDLKSGAPVLLIADECHRYESGQNRLIFEFLPYIKDYGQRFFSLGLSATLPSGPAMGYLSSVLGKKIYSYSMAQAASLQQISQYDVFHIGLSFSRSEQEAYEEISDRMKLLYANLLHKYPYLKDLNRKECFEHLRALSGNPDQKTAEAAASYMKLSFKRKSLICLASARVLCAHDLVLRLPAHDKILIFGERIDQAEELYLLLQKSFPGKVGRYHSRMGQQANHNALCRFRDGETRILIACKAIDEGLDVPDASVGIILSGTSMQRQRVQRLGRILRLNKGKDRAALYYLHVTKSAEDCVFLPDAKTGRILELEYEANEREFIHPAYDRAVAALLPDLLAEETDPKRLAEIQRCLHVGRVRADWLLDRGELARKLQNATDTGERNYWFCMKKIAGPHP